MAQTLRTQSLDLLRFPLALFVVTVHVFDTTGVMLIGGRFETTGFPMFVGVNAFIDAFVRGVSVPIYFFISGYVFFLNFHKEGEREKQAYVRKFKNRVKTLLIPYVIWISAEILMTVVTHLHIFSGLFSYSGTEVHLSWSSIFHCFWRYSGELVSVLDPSFDGGAGQSPYPLVVPLWFLRDLMIVVLCTPLLRLLLKKLKIYALVGMGILLVCPIGERIGLLANAFFFFSWGAYMSIFKKDMLETFRPYFSWSLAAYILSGVAILAWHDDYWCNFLFTKLKAFSALLLAYNLASWLLRNSYCKVNTFLASASFFIYVSHALLSQRLRKVCFLVMQPETDLGVISTYLSCEILLVGSLLLAFYLLRRYCPVVLKVIAGRK